MTEQELRVRIEQVEAGVPEVRRMSKRDYIQVGVVVLICLAGIVAGAFL